MNEKKSELDLLIEKLSTVLIVLICLAFSFIAIELFWQGLGLDELVK